MPQDCPQEATDGRGRATAEREERIRRVVSKYFEAWAAGETVHEDGFIAAHAELMPELGERLRQARRIRLAADSPPAAASADATEGFPTNREGPSEVPPGLRIRCPHCRQAVELVADAPFSDVTCTACGSTFSLVEQGTSTHTATALKRIAHFELVGRLGLGSFGTVWKAHDTDLERTVAIKIPRRELLDVAEEEKFLREARAAAQLKHPNIVAVHEVGRDGDTLYIVSDLVRGVTLADWLTAHRLSHGEIAKLCTQLARALEHAHERGVVHRDLKPSNIMLDERGEPHIMDFGLAKRDAGEITMTLDGQILGTPAYMSPEQARGDGRTVDRRSDIYSLGVILFELLTGELPFRGNVRMLVFQVIHEDPPSPRTLESHVPRDLETICLKCLAKDPRNRYQTARDLAEELERFVDGRPIRARRISRSARLWRWCRRNPEIAALLALVVVVAAVAPWVAVNQWVLSGRAVREAQRADGQRQVVAAQRNRLRELLYVAHINMAQQALDEANVERAVELLSRYSDSDLRSFEWFHLWREAHRHELVLQSHSHPIVAAALAADGRTLATAESSGKILLGDPETGKAKAEIFMPERKVTAIALLPTGDALVTGDETGEVCIWDVGTGALRATLGRHSARVNAVAVDPGGRRVASASTDRTAAVWDVDSPGSLQRFEHVGIVTSVAFLPDGERLATGSRDSLVRIWNLDSGEAETLLDHDAAVSCIAVGGDGQALLSGTDRGLVTLWDVASGETQQSWQHHTGDVTSVAVSGQGHLLSAGRDSTIRLWGAAEQGPSATIKGHSGGVRAAMFFDGGQALATAGQEGAVKLWQTRDLLVSDLHRPHEQFLDELRIVPRSSTPLSVGHDRATKWAAKLWSLGPEPRPRTLLEQPAPLLALAISPDGRTMAVSRTLQSSDVFVCDVASGRIVRELKAQQAAVLGLAFVGNERLTAASVDGTVRVWSLDALDREESLPSDRRLALWCLAASDDGRWLAAGTDSASAVLWDMRSMKRRSLRAGDTGKIEALAFSPDARLLAAAGPGNEATVWQVETRERVATLSGHGQSVSAVAFSHDGRTVASGSQDGTLVLWDVATWEPKLYLSTDRVRLQSLAFTQDDASLLAGRMDGRVHVWRGGSDNQARGSSQRKKAVSQ